MIGGLRWSRDDGQMNPCGEGEGEEERLWGLLV